MKLLSRMRLDERGAVTMELALLAPILGAMIVGIAEMSLAISAKTKLEQAVQRGVEMVQQGVADTTKLSQVQADVAAAAGIATANVSVTSLVDCVGGTQVAQAETYICPSGTATARYVKITAFSSYTPLFAKNFGGNRQADGTYRIATQSTVRVQ